MKKFGYEDPSAFRAHLFVLLGTDYDDTNDESSLCMEMRAIQGYLESCYDLSINPLRELRRILPQFKWQFTRCKDIKKARQIVAQADLVWQIFGEFRGGDEKIEFVTTTSSRKPRKLFFAGRKEEYEPDTKWIKFAEACGGDPVYSQTVST